MNKVLNYPGAKHRLCQWILQYIPEHNVYLEPYAGSLAVLLNKPRCHIETVNDIDGRIVNFFRVLRNQPDEFARLIRYTPYSREEYNLAFEETEDPLEAARRFAVKCWMGFGGAVRYKNGFKNGTKYNAPNTAKAWASLSDIIIPSAQRLCGVQIEHMDAIPLIKRYDSEEVFIYLDPPYLQESRKRDLYKFEYSYEQHETLLAVIKKHKAKILLSGYDNELYHTNLKDWKKITIKTQAEKGSVRKEVLWMNYEPPSQQILMEGIEVC